MREGEFIDDLVTRMTAHFTKSYHIGSKINLLYGLTVDDKGNLKSGLDENKRVLRGRGSGFEQDILVYEKVEEAYTQVVPRVIAEVKMPEGFNTHEILAYAEKARRIRTVYPYARYGLLLGNKRTIPPRTIRLGQEFDFIVALASPATQDEVDALAELLLQEIETSKVLATILPGMRKAKQLRRVLAIT
jgi:hypothetical protein